MRRILGFHSVHRRVSSVRDEKSARRRPRATSAQFRVIPPRLRGGGGGLLVFVRVLIPLRSIYIYIHTYTNFSERLGSPCIYAPLMMIPYYFLATEQS